MTNIIKRTPVYGSLQQQADVLGKPLTEMIMDANIAIVIDVSASMMTRDAPAGLTRHQYAQKQLEKVQETIPGKALIVAFNSVVIPCFDGILPEPTGNTDLTAALEYVRRYFDLPGREIIVISDGAPNNPVTALAAAATLQSRISTIFCGDEHTSVVEQKFLRDLAQAGKKKGTYDVAIRGKELADKTIKLLTAPLS